MAIPVAVHATRHGCDRRICLPCRACARVAFGRTDGQVLHFDWTGPDLESRIHQRRTELIATLGELKADLRLATTEVRDRMKARLSELAHIIKLGVVDGWTNLGDTVKHKLEHWLAESERAMQDLPARNGKSG